MASAPAGDKSLPKEEELSSSPSSSSSNFDVLKNRFVIPTILAGIAGAGVGLLSRHRKIHGVSAISSAYAANFAIVTGCYCGAREFTRVSRTGKPDDLLNSVIGGIGSGALLGRLQGGQVAAARYAVMFAAVGTSVDYAIVKLRPSLVKWYDSVIGTKDKANWFKLPEWSPIRVLDEEALAAKRAREEKIYRKAHELYEEKS